MNTLFFSVALVSIAFMSSAVTYREWIRRPWTERGHECLGWLLERQQ